MEWMTWQIVFATTPAAWGFAAIGSLGRDALQQAGKVHWVTVLIMVVTVIAQLARVLEFFGLLRR
jgi:hypothetical protein